MTDQDAQAAGRTPDQTYDETPDSDPSMDEILVSIRQIITDDETPPAPTLAETATPPHGDPMEDEIGAALDRVPPSTETLAPPAPGPATAPASAASATTFSDPAGSSPAAAERASGEGLASVPVAAAAAAAFDQLDQAVASGPSAGDPLGQVVRELLRPQLKAWLDEHLPRIVEDAVGAELERIARRGSR